MTDTTQRPRYDRRTFVGYFASIGLGSTLLPGLLWARAARGEEITVSTIACAEEVAGLSFEDDERQLMVDGLKSQEKQLEALHAITLPNSVAPAVSFDAVLPNMKLDTHSRPMVRSKVSPVDVPSELEALAFLPVTQLSELVRRRKVTSTQLTKMYLARLKKYDPVLHFVITLTEERALAQAKAVDDEIARGRYRGPLHGIPWGAKDLLAVKGYPTTWGAGGFEHQSFDEDATVVQRLDAAGAVLVAKLTLGALAMGDKWFGGQTRNPWNPAQGSSGSSAGSAAAVAAGCVGFAIGSETLGSISSPCTRCGCTGLRPSFGLVPRTGAMALSWTMDKLGPIGRSVADCALILDAIHGPDGHDTSVMPAGYRWDPSFNWRTLRVGYLKSEFDPPAAPQPSQPKTEKTAEEKKKREAADAAARDDYARRVYDRRYLLAALDKLRSMGVELIPAELPKLPWEAMQPLLMAEAAAAFDELTMTGRDRLLTGQNPDDWPNIFRIARFYPAVEYIQANRARTLAVRQVTALFEQVDILLTPESEDELIATNLTGHPALILPNGLRGSDAPPPPAVDDGNHDNIGGPGTPVSLTFLAGHFQDARLAAFANAYQEATGFQHLHPPTGPLEPSRGL